MRLEFSRAETRYGGKVVIGSVNSCGVGDIREFTLKAFGVDAGVEEGSIYINIHLVRQKGLIWANASYNCQN